MAAGVKVRGSCRAGHLTEATAPPGRLTWHGQCSHDGCTLPVTAKRIPRDRAEATPASNTGEPAVNTDDHHPFVEIDSYEQLGDDAAGGLTVDEPAHPAAPVAGDVEPAAGEDPDDGRQPDPVTDEPRRNRLTDRLRSRRHRDWQHPLL